MKVTIFRGISGSGKSTLAKQLHKEMSGIGWTAWCSADHYFTKLNGEYRFDASKLSEAHQSCLKGFTERLLMPDQYGIIVDNTNTTAIEIAPYAQLALAFGHHVETHTIECDVETAVARNVHSVPRAVIVNQFKRLNDETRKLRSEWNNRIYKP